MSIGDDPLADLGWKRAQRITRSVWRGERVDDADDAVHAVKLARWGQRVWVDNPWIRIGLPLLVLVIIPALFAFDLIARDRRLWVSLVLHVPALVVNVWLWWWTRRILKQRLQRAVRTNAAMEASDDEADD